MWAAWDCYLTAFRDVLGLKLPCHEKYDAWERCAIDAGGFRIMHSEFCMVIDRPEILRVDEQNRPHCDDGPSHRWRDGWSLYYVHGVQVPDYVVENPEQITVAAIDRESNAEVRRVMMERYGYERYITDSGALVVDELPENHPVVGLQSARLLRKEVVDDESIVFVDLLNSSPEPDGTTRRYKLRVDPEAYEGRAGKNVIAAAASTWRNADGSLFFAHPEDYVPMVES